MRVERLAGQTVLEAVEDHGDRNEGGTLRTLQCIWHAVLFLAAQIDKLEQRGREP